MHFLFLTISSLFYSYWGRGQGGELPRKSQKHLLTEFSLVPKILKVQFNGYSLTTMWKIAGY